MRTLLLLLLPCALLAQRATLSGVVTDATGAVVPGVAISAENQETLVKTGTRTNPEGVYTLPLAPGVYRVEAAASGFQTLVREGVSLDLQQVARLNLTLQIGETTQRVDVNESSAPVLTESPSVESAVTREQIATLPLNSRDFNQLVLLAAGAVENINSGNNRDFGAVAANGNRAFSNDYLLDGVPNNDVYQGRSAVPVSIDLIREFKVTSGVASAEYGQAGTQISVATRTGTNRIHGSLFEYYRGETLQARNPFNTVAPQPFGRHQFGGSLGGPIRRNRTFYFVNYEGNRQDETQTRVATVPQDAFWRGDFSSLLPRVVLRDPLSPDRPVIPNNRLDQYLGGARINRAAARLQPIWGSPNQPGLVNNAIRNVSETTRSHQFTVRGDHAFANGHNLALRYTESRLDNAAPSLLGNGAGLLRPVDNRNASATVSNVLRPNLVHEFRFGYARFDSVTSYNDGGLPTIESLGLRGFEKGDNLVPPMPRITFAGGDAFTQLNYGTSATFGMASLKRVSTTITLSDTLTYVRGRHSLKAGFDLRNTELPSLQQTNARGTMNFSGAGALSSGYPFADFLMGIPSTTQEVPLKPDVLLRQSEIASYVQDDWRVNSRLTLNFGVRHEIFLNPTEDRARIAMFDIGTGGMVVASRDGQMPTNEFLPSVVAKLAPNGRWPFPLVTDVEAGLTPGRILLTRYRYFGPRAGFAWQPFAQSRTLLRGGYGIFYTRYPRQYLLQTLFINPPFAGVFNHTNTIADGVSRLTVDAPFPTAGGSATVSPAGMQRDFGLPYNQQWNLTVERDLGWGVVGSLGYVGNRGVHLFRSINANGQRLNEAGQIVRPLSAVFGTSAINYRQTDGNSIYHSMLLEFRKRARRGLSFQGNWTWAKGLDDTGQTVQAALLDVQNLGRDRADSDYVRRHQITVNGTWDLPSRRSLPRAARLMVNNWRASGIWRFTTGRYFTPQFTAQGGLANNRPDVVAGVAANLPRGERSPQRWFNPAAFVPVPATDPATGLPRFGNAGRNILTGPGLNTMDASLAKLFPIGEGRSIQFRLEAFNAMNTPNFDLPANNLSQTNLVGTINEVVLPARQVQFALRFEF